MGAILCHGPSLGLEVRGTLSDIPAVRPPAAAVPISSGRRLRGELAVLHVSSPGKHVLLQPNHPRHLHEKMAEVVGMSSLKCVQ